MCTDIINGLQICNKTIILEIFADKMYLKTFKLAGKFHFKTANSWGPLKFALGAIEGLTVFISIEKKLTAYNFRMGLTIQFRSQSAVLSVQSTSVFFEWGIGSANFRFGGNIVLLAKIGTAENYPKFTVTVAFNLIKQRLDLDAEMSNCWASAFGVKGLSICDVGLGVSIGPVFPFLTRFLVRGAISFGQKLKFLLVINVDLLTPLNSVLIAKFEGTLDISDLIFIVVDLATKASGKKSSSVSRPTVPLLVFKKIMIKIAGKAIVIQGVHYSQGFTFDLEMILLGVTIKAGMNVDMYGVSAWLVFSRIKFLPCFMICKDHHCKPEEGPTLKFELKTLPPSFKLEASVFANVFGFKFGVIILIQWTSVYRLKANFSFYPIELAGGALKITKSKYDTAPGPGGPNCGFDSGTPMLWLSGRITLLGVSLDAWIMASKTSFVVRQEIEFWFFKFVFEVAGSLPGGGKPAGLTIKLEASNSADKDLREKIRRDVHAKLDEWKKAGERAINAAKDKVKVAERKLVSVQAGLTSKINNLEKKKRDVHKWFNCGGEELTLLQKQYDSERPQRLLEWKEHKQSLLNKWREARKRNREEHLRKRDAQALTTTDFNARAFEATDRDDELEDIEATEQSLLVAHSQAHWGGVGKFVKKVGKAIYKHVIKPIVNAACVAAREIAKGALSVAQGALYIAKGAVGIAQGALWLVQRALDGVLALNAAVFAILKGLVSMALGITYVKLQATLRLNILDSCISGELKYELGGTKLHLSGEICLRQLWKIVVNLFRKCIEALGNWIMGKEEEMYAELLQEQEQSYDEHLELMFETSEVENLPSIENLQIEDQPEKDNTFSEDIRMPEQV